MRDRKQSLAAALMAVVLAAGLLGSPPAAAQGKDPSPAGTAQRVGESVFDVLVLRPLGLAACAVGSAFFVPAALLTAPGGRDAIEEAADLFVTIPCEYVFKRPLGEF